MDNILIFVAAIGAGTFLYIYVAPVYSGLVATLNGLPF